MPVPAVPSMSALGQRTFERPKTSSAFVPQADMRPNDFSYRCSWCGKSPSFWSALSTRRRPGLRLGAGPLRRFLIVDMKMMQHAMENRGSVRLLFCPILAGPMPERIIEAR